LPGDHPQQCARLAAASADAKGRYRARWPRISHQPIRIGAQARLETFYNRHGFVQAVLIYDEDGIDHIEMVRPV
jgi:ElaA protein